MKNSFAPVFSGILDSSLWEEAYAVRILFVSMLALKDSDHVVRFNDYQLHRRANLKLQEVQEALKLLEAPDPRRTGQEHDGRRIRKVDDGWLILNGQFYENQMRMVSLRAYQARKQREYRDRKSVKPLPGQTAILAAQERGDQAGADAIEKELEDEAVARAAGQVDEPVKAVKPKGGLEGSNKSPTANRSKPLPPVSNAPPAKPLQTTRPMAGVKTGNTLTSPVIEKLRSSVNRPRPAAVDPRKVDTLPRDAAGMVPGTGAGSMFSDWGEKTIAKAGTPPANPPRASVAPRPLRAAAPSPEAELEQLSEEPPVD